MDREKAIQILKRCEAEAYCSHYKHHFCCIGCGQREALDLAIEALGDAENATTTATQKQVAGKLKNPDDSLLTEDSEACKEQKSKLESEDCVSRQQAIEEIKNATTITGWNKYASQEEIVDDVERQLRRLFVGAIESLPPVEPEEVIPHRNYKNLSDYWCECGWHLGKKGEVKYCARCGRKVNWDE